MLQRKKFKIHLNHSGICSLAAFEKICISYCAWVQSGNNSEWDAVNSRPLSTAALWIGSLIGLKKPCYKWQTSL